jgi:hypothetical protein
MRSLAAGRLGPVVGTIGRFLLLLLIQHLIFVERTVDGEDSGFRIVIRFPNPRDAVGSITVPEGSL